MPQNPGLFPPDYTDLCPRTDAPEDNGLEEILRALTALRHQHLLAARRSGQSIAELQNQSLIALDCCTPTPINPPAVEPPPVPPITRKIFFGGGEFHGIHGQIDKFVPETNQVAAIGFSFTTRRMRHAALSASAKGYWLGGETDGGSGLSSVEAIRFTDESKATIASILTAPMVYNRGASGESKGYSIGTASGSTKRFEIFSFSAETIAAGGTMPVVSGGCNTGQSDIKAYACAGINQTERNFDAITFSTDTPAALSALLSVARRRGVGLSSASRLYIGGGVSSTAGFQDGFDAFSFSSEALATIGAKLAMASDDIEGMGLGLWGVMGQGFQATPGHHLQKFTFSQEVCQEIDAVLSRGSRYSSAVGKI
jgi:hypothetical protein